MPAYLTGLGSSFPGPPLEQDAIWDGYFAARSGHDAVARRIFSAAGVERRHAAVNPLVEDVSGWSTGERMRRWAGPKELRRPSKIRVEKIGQFQHHDSVKSVESRGATPGRA